MEREPRDRRSLDILSVKKEAKLSASEVNDVEVGRGEADLRQSNLFTFVNSFKNRLDLLWFTTTTYTMFTCAYRYRIHAVA